MTISEEDLKAGQLALARGGIDLSALLDCVRRAAGGEMSLRSLLCSRGELDTGIVDELFRDLQEMNDEELRSAVDLGATMIIHSLQGWQRNQEMVQGLLEPIESTKTLDLPPGGTSENIQKGKGFEIDASAETRYDFVEELGRGGMGQILRAHDRLLGREIALKTLLPDAKMEDPQLRLMAEARLTGRLEHPSIVPVYELGRLSNGEPYYTMRVIKEESLESRLEEIRQDKPGAPTLLQLVQILRQVCLAIQYAHDRGVIHRDLKPENILIGEYGEVFVIDWGIAKVLSHVLDLPDPTESAVRKGSLLGTPLYMAPEQAQGDNEAVDERTDVYALGAILYEMMTLKPVFEASTVLGLLMTIIQEEPEPPSLRAPERKVPAALEEIALRAIAKAPEDRYPSAQALANELDLFIEGVKEKERNLASARALVEKARLARQEYTEKQEALAEALRRRDELRRQLGAVPAEEERIRLWDNEDQVDSLRVEAERHFGETTRLLSQSLVHASLDEAHDILAEMYWERFLDAERRRDRAMAAYFEGLILQHDRGPYQERLRGLANLEVSAGGIEATLLLKQVTEFHRRLISETIFRSDAGTPLRAEKIPHGQYYVEASSPHHASLHFPVLLERQADRKVEVPLFLRSAVPEDFVVIPAGEFQEGPPQEPGSSPQWVHLPAFAIKRTPVTCGEYVSFLNDLADDDLEAAMSHAPRTQETGPSYFPFREGRFWIPEEDSDGDAWDPNWPICIVNHHDARAFARWRSQKDGRSYRLPTSQEWEKAGRGVDGRLYPWGEHFDPSFCMMRDSRAGKPMPVPVGTFPADSSPYGAVDMAGNISEWTSTPYRGDPEIFILRGGSFNSLALMCRLDWQMHSPAWFRFTHYGFRLVLDLGEPD